MADLVNVNRPKKDGAKSDSAKSIEEASQKEVRAEVSNADPVITGWRQLRVSALGLIDKIERTGIDAVEYLVSVAENVDRHDKSAQEVTDAAAQAQEQDQKQQQGQEQDQEQGQKRSAKPVFPAGLRHFRQVREDLEMAIRDWVQQVKQENSSRSEENKQENEEEAASPEFTTIQLARAMIDDLKQRWDNIEKEIDYSGRIKEYELRRQWQNQLAQIRNTFADKARQLGLATHGDIAKVNRMLFEINETYAEAKGDVPPVFCLVDNRRNDRRSLDFPVEYERRIHSRRKDDQKAVGYHGLAEVKSNTSPRERESQRREG